MILRYHVKLLKKIIPPCIQEPNAQIPYDYYEIKAFHDQLIADGIVYEEDSGMTTNVTYSNPYHTFVPTDGKMSSIWSSCSNKKNQTHFSNF
jgi:hypothetical protein